LAIVVVLVAAAQFPAKERSFRPDGRSVLKFGGVSRPKSERAERRARQRAIEKLARQRERLARLEPGGSAGRPIEVDTAAVIETRAESGECLRCGEAVRVIDHRAETHDGARVRVVVVRCSQCGAERTSYFTIRSPS
jgi:hypothetical protein